MTKKQPEFIIPEYNLADLLKDNHPGCFEITDEEREWLDMEPVGLEFGAGKDGYDSKN